MTAERRGRDRGVRLRGFLAACAGALLAAPALAWNAAGHRLVADIAWLQMAPATREQATQLLRAHPDYERWRQRAGKDDPARAIFAEASTWPDEIRKDPRFHDAGREAPTPPLPGFPDMEQHRDWHFLNRPLGSAAKAAAVRGTIDVQLVSLAEALDRRRADVVDADRRSYALPWLVHLVGDAHQPLHASLAPDADRAADERLVVINPFNPRRPRSTLHAYWDDLPGPPWLRGERLAAQARALLQAHAPPAQAASDEWLAESWRLARDEAFPSGAENPLLIDAAFHDKSRRIADRRVAEAGYRLGALLDRLLGAPAP